MKDGIELTALWKNSTNDGKEYLSGYLGKSKLLVFPNGYKTRDEHPDYVVYIVEQKKKEDEDTPKREVGGFPKKDPTPEKEDKEVDLDDIPF